ncbi:GNAT family N-acetyltransferase [Pseudoalteromonas rubra]|uniref:GCN5 family acetyltransferase n=1 Tax=Pseudoalteromonas rubra TaxID=43658 RepID=A0A0U3IAT0_9GAMM|nr:GNAT family protein [Pseudoalteromonas rubra]ALU45199.1 GCN5 family acetyltransferase [Pseudoalteromonas rubra]
MWIKNTVLEGLYIRLEPLSIEHVEELQEAVQDGESWKLWYASVPAPDQMQGYVEKALSKVGEDQITFVVRSIASGHIVGTTRYYDIKPEHKRASIGYTWYSAAVRRTPVNTEAKLLLMENLFEQCGALSLEFKTHFFNHASRQAIERLGAKLDGVLRSHQVLPDGSIRDTVVYSILASEWPAVRNHLKAKLTAR